MNTNPVTPTRFVLTATVKEEYDADQDGYDAIAKEPTLAALSTENDQVGGLEGLYGYVINHRPRPATALTQVEGSEGFMDTLRSGISGLVQMVKDFFKWVFSFMSGKGAKIKSDSVKTEQKLKAKGVKDGEIPYSTGTFRIYPKDGKPDSNLSWMPGVLSRLNEEAGRIEAYGKLIEEYCAKVERDLTSNHGKGHEGIREAFHKGARGIFKPDDNGQVMFVLKAALHYDEKNGKLTKNGVPNNFERFKTASYRVTQHEAESLVTSSLGLGKRIDNVLNHLATSETPIVRSLNKLLSSVKGDNPEETKSLQAGTDLIKEVVRVGMSNLQLMETTLIKAHSVAVGMIAKCAKD